MGKVHVFNSVSLDGYFSGPNGDLGWAHKDGDDPEWSAFVSENASGDGVLLFGRITYELMAAFWPTPAAMETMPKVAEGMNNMTKVVFSRKLKKAAWSNTKLVKGDIAEEVRKLKKTSKDITILGSGSIVSQLTQARLVDQYDLVVVPVVLGKGRTMFEGVRDKLGLRLTKTRNFKNGSVVLTYVPVAEPATR